MKKADSFPKESMFLKDGFSWGLAYLALFTIAFLFFWEATVKGKMLATPGSGGSDITHLNYPSRHYLGETLRKEGRIPLWCPYIFNGFPIHAEGQGGFLYPPNYILFRFLPSPTAFTYSVVLTFFIAGSGAMAFGRLLGLGVLGSLTSAIIFMLSGFFVAHVRHLNMIQAASMFPWGIFFAEKFLRTGRFFFATASGVMLGLSILAGHPQIVYYSAGAVILYVLLRGLWREDNTTLFPKALLGIFIILLVGIGLGAAQWIPTYELFQESVRESGISHREAVKWSYLFRDLITFFSPYYSGHPSKGAFLEIGDSFWENFFYVGVLSLGLSCITIFLRLRKKGVVYIFTIIIAVAFGLALSSILGLDSLLRTLVPGFGFFRVHQRVLYLAVFCLALLSGLGISFLIEKCGQQVGIPLLGILAFDLFAAGYRENAYAAKVSWFQPPPMLSIIKEKPGRIMSLNSEAHEKAYEVSQGWARDMSVYTVLKQVLQPNSNIEWGVYAIDGHGTLVVSRFDKLWQIFLRNAKWINAKRDFAMTSLGIRILKLQNMRYILTFYDTPMPGFRLVLEREIYPGMRNLRVYENLNSIPRAFVVSGIRHASSADEALRLVQDGNFDPVRAVILEEALRFPSEPSGKWRAEINDETSRHLELSVYSENAGFLVLSDTFFPGWKAYINGEEMPSLRANYAFRAVRLPAGSHEVLFRYAPPSYRLGRWISTLTFGIFLIGGVWFIRRKNGT